MTAMKMTMNDIRSDGLSTSSRQAQIALDTRQDAINAGKSAADAIDAGITAGLAVNGR